MKFFGFSRLVKAPRLARLARDTRGVAAAEFAIVVPVMLVLFFGSVEFSSAVAVNRKVAMTAQSLADLASRYTSVTDTDLSNFFAIGAAMLTPYSSTPLGATVTEIYIDPTSGAARTQWSSGSAPRAVSSVFTVPANLIMRDSSNKIIAAQYLIFTEISYVYTPAVGYVMKSAVTLKGQSYMVPRVTSCVLYNTATGNCPTN